MIDLSHVSEATMLGALETSLAPVIFTHSSACGLVESPRNTSDLCLQKLKANNGVIMISFIPALTHSDTTTADLTHVVDHILYVAEKIGFDHIGIGSDFDGMVKAVSGLEDVSKYPDLVATMLCKGIQKCDVKKVIGLNTIRVLKEVEEAGHRHTKDLPVLEDEVKQLWDENMRAFVRSKYPAAEHDVRRPSNS
ncbi:MAG: hypothetical protein M1830_004695 [Pleopsidium flavum]|nr:MAG: hypothetical protein M1830_004695 [Pleopsidium flavum]